MEKEQIECCHCKKGPEETKLEKCVICHKLFCYDCGYKMSGSFFCSQYCAEYFFFGED